MLQSALTLRNFRGRCDNDDPNTRWMATELAKRLVSSHIERKRPKPKKRVGHARSKGSEVTWIAWPSPWPFNGTLRHSALALLGETWGASCQDEDGWQSAHGGRCSQADTRRTWPAVVSAG